LSGVKKTLEFAESLDTDWKGFYCLRPLPGSEIFEDCRKAGLIRSFEPQYGELYFAPDLKHIDYTSQQLSDMSYMANLKSNFINNRNLRISTDRSLSQAERDFRYVLDMVPDHVFACAGMAEIMRRRKRSHQSEKYMSKARRIVAQKDSKWKNYLGMMKIDLDAMFAGTAK
jgi:hypothetical protein